MTITLASFLRNLALDPGLREALRADRESVLADSCLSDVEKDLFRSDGCEQLLAREYVDAVPGTNL